MYIKLNLKNESPVVVPEGVTPLCVHLYHLTLVCSLWCKYQIRWSLWRQQEEVDLLLMPKSPVSACTQ